MGRKQGVWKIGALRQDKSVAYKSGQRDLELVYFVSLNLSCNSFKTGTIMKFTLEGYKLFSTVAVPFYISTSNA